MPREANQQLQWEQEQMDKLQKLSKKELIELSEGLNLEQSELKQLQALTVYEMAKRIAREI